MKNYEFEYAFFTNEDGFTRTLNIGVWVGTKRVESMSFENFMKSIKEVKQYLKELETRFPNMIIRWDKIFDGVIEINENDKELCLICDNESKSGLCEECAEKYSYPKINLDKMLEKFANSAIKNDENTIKYAFEIKEMFDKVLEENEQYKEINQGLLEVQFSLRDREKEYRQWFELASKNVKKLENEVHRLKEGVDDTIFYLANEDVSDVNVIEEIRMDLVKLYNGGIVNKHPFNK